MTNLEDLGALENLKEKNSKKEEEENDKAKEEDSSPKRNLRSRTKASATTTSKVTKAEDDKKKQPNVLKASQLSSADLPSHAVIRHFHVDRVYQQAGVQYDLARTVIGDVFSSSSSSDSSNSNSTKEKGQKQVLEKILVRITSVQLEAETMWRRLGFKESALTSSGKGKSAKVKVLDSKVIFGEYETWLEMTRERWEKLEQSTAAPVF